MKQSKITKKENEDLEKQVNNLIKNTLRLIINTACFLLLSSTLYGQILDDTKRKDYNLTDISIEGQTVYSAETIITYSGLKKGDIVTIPGGVKISNAIKKLWDSNLFNNIDVFISKIEGDEISLQIKLDDLPELKDVKITGVKKGKISGIIEENKLNPGVKVTENLITTTKNYLESKYRKDGFLKAKTIITTTTVIDSVKKSRVNMTIRIDRGDKVKINKIEFHGNDKVSNRRLLKAMKKTKKKNPIRLYKRSKYIEADYREDLANVVNKLKEKGYRDARIISDSLNIDKNGDISLKVNVEEGEKYTYGTINFLGNTIYSDQQLNQVLKIKKGDTYNGVELEKRIADNSDPDAFDLTNLYQNNGYLFSTITPVEISADGNVIDMEIRVTEGKPAYFNNVSVKGNDATNDHVVYRELRTRPGQLYSKSNVVRTIRELGQLGYFDAQEISPDLKNVNANDGTLDVEYVVVEKGTGQFQLQGGYGGGGFIGTVGASFVNFSIKNLFNKEAWKPVPRGDGQSLSLRLQTSRFFSSYSLSFSEPWLGGEKPVQFSTSISQTKQYLYNRATRSADKDRSFNITGITVGIAKKLNVPDDYFVLSQSFQFQYYDLNNYNTGLFSFGNGSSNNLAYTIGLSRNNTFNDPIYPVGGSNFSLSAKATFPYSAVNGVDYAALREEREQKSQRIQELSTSTDDNDIIERNEASERIVEIDQERYKWLEFYKIKFSGDWYAKIKGNLVLRPKFEFGFLGAYNNDRGVIPFERFFVGGDGMQQFSRLDGREAIPLRGYPNQSLSDNDGGSIYNKFSLELRHPITLKGQTKIFAMAFLEGGSSYNNFRDFNPFSIKRSAGIGIRLFMPAFGLLGIDFGHGFDPIPGQVGKSGWQTHFVLGQQF
ncbi:MAG: outer membrane protein assembly factor BamA [Flavobacteriaceae bacterium]|nr:outer membrane protein assembly factor BamA [Flavobacteriaceae bacterium]